MLNSVIFNIINYFAKIFRGKNYTIDRSIPLMPLLSLSIGRGFSLLRCITKGAAFLPRNLIFIGKNTKIHNKSYISFGKHVILGDNVTINGLSKKGISIGNHVSIGSYTKLEASGSILNLGEGITIGDNTGIGDFSFIGGAGGIKIGQNVIMGQWVSFHPENHNYDSLDLPIRLQGVNRKGITIGDDCWIGVKATFLDGSHLGKGCIVAAGAVVRGNIPDYSIIAGVPAKIVKSRIQKNNA